MRLDFQHQHTLRTLTASLLHRDFGLRVHLPVGKLVPTLPLRLNYIHWLEDVLAVVANADVGHSIVRPPITGIDIGCGASCVYPLLGARTNNWRMFALESNPASVEHARDNVRQNHMTSRIEVVPQHQQPQQSLRIFDSLLALLAARATTASPTTDRIADFCMCNPPFYAADGITAAFDGIAAANRSGHRPAPRLRLCTTSSATAAVDASLDELTVAGGETAFVAQIIAESVELRQRIRVYSTMLGHKANVRPVLRLLAELGIRNVARTEFCQGRTTRWAIAWTFDDTIRLASVPATGPTCGGTLASAAAAKRRTFSYDIPGASEHRLLEHQQRLERILNAVGLQLVEKRQQSGDLWLAKVSTSANTWSNQRRRRREMQRAAAAAATATVFVNVPEQSNDAMDVGTAVDEETSSVSSTMSKEDESFYADEVCQLNCDDELAATKRMRMDGGNDAVCVADAAQPDVLLCVQLSLARTVIGGNASVQLTLEYLSGSAGRDGAYQLMQFIRNQWK